MSNKKKKTALKFRQPNKTIWLDRGYQPCYIGFCPSKKAWDEMIKRLGIKDYAPYPDKDACVSQFTNPKGKLCLVVCINERFDKHAPLNHVEHVSVVSLLVHECIHVWQFILRNIGETGVPSQELEAYSVQWIFQQVYAAYLDTRILRKSK